MFAKTSRWIAYPVVWLLLMLVPLMIDAFRAQAGPASATNQFTINSFVASYDTHRSGDGLALDVTERITANFPIRNTNRGIERRLVPTYGGTDIELSGFKVTDPRGRSLAYSKRTDNDGAIVLRIGRSNTYVYGPVDYVIQYTIGRAMVQAEDRQEIYLDTNGTGWQQPFDRVQATVNVSADLAGSLLDQQSCYRGPAGSTLSCSIGRSGNAISTEAIPLAPRESMTIAVGFAAGTVANTVPAPAGSLGWPGVLTMPVLGALMLALALLVRRQRLRSLLLRDDAAIQYDSPNVQPILAADFLGLPERGAAAQLAQLVLDGHAKVSSDEAPIGTAPQRRGRLSRSERAAVRELRVRLIDRKNIDSSVAEICSLLFGRGKSVPLGNVAPKDIEKASTERQALLATNGLRRTSWVGGLLFWLLFVTLILLGWFQLALGLGGLLWPFLAAGTLAVLLAIAGAHYYPTVGRLTRDGKELRDHLAGLHRFVTMAEAERIAWMQNAVDASRVAGPDGGSLVELYEPLLPYAIIFGVEDTWREGLGNLYDRRGQPSSHTVDLTTLNLMLSWADSSPDYYRRASTESTFWDSRPRWGQGWVAGAGRGLSKSLDGWATSRHDDRGGSWGSGGSSSRSWSSLSRSSGSSGGGSSGGGMGGGGGGGW